MSNYTTWDQFLNQGVKDWETFLLGELFSNRQEQNFTSLKLLSVTASEGIVERDSLDRRDTSNSDKAKYLRVVPGDIAYNTMRMWQGVSGRAKQEGIVSPAYTVLTPTNKINSHFGAFLLKLPLLVQRFHQNSQGLVDDTLNLKYQNFSPISVKIPPLKEQQKIAEILTSVDEVIENTQSQINKLEDLKRATMNELLTKGIGHTEFKETEIGRIPKGWMFSTLGESVTLAGGGTPSRSMSTNFSQTKEGIPWFKTTDLNDELLYSPEEFISEKGCSESSCKLHPRHSVLIAMYGGWNQIGRTGILAYPATTNQAITTVYPQENLLPEFLNSWLVTKRFLWRKIAASSRKDPNITKGDIERFPVVFPTLDEQREIVQIHRSLQVQVGCKQRQMHSYLLLKNSLMLDLLTGKVRVTVN